MEGFLHTVGHVLALIVEAIALFIIAVGTVEALFQMVRIFTSPRSTGDDRRGVWLDFARWLVAALTFQLAADLIGTSFLADLERNRPSRRHRGDSDISEFTSLDREVENTRRQQRERCDRTGCLEGPDGGCA